MRGIFTGTFAVVVLGAAIVSTQGQAPQGGQSEPGVQKPDTETPAGGNAQPGTPAPSANQARGTTTTYRGYLRPSSNGGYTITPISDRKSGGGGGNAAGAAGASVGTSGEAATYTLLTGQGAKTDFATFANQCVEIVGTAAPTSGMQGGAGAAANAGAAGGEVAAGVAAGANAGAGGNPKGPETTTRSTDGAQAGAAAGGAAGTARPQTITVTTIRAAQGSCTE